MLSINVKKNPGLYEACKLVNKKDPRKYTTHIFINNGFLFATNAYSMLTMETTIEDGIYKVIKCTKTHVDIYKVPEEIDCPDFNVIVEQVKDYNKWYEFSSPGLICYHLAKEYDTAVDPFRLDVVERNIKQLEYFKANEDGNSPVCFKFDDFTYILMPLFKGK